MDPPAVPIDPQAHQTAFYMPPQPQVLWVHQIDAISSKYGAIHFRLHVWQEHLAHT
jgi:hypothetical protein